MTAKKKSNHIWWITVAISLMTLAVNLDFSAINLALVGITQTFNAGINTTQWVLSGYVLAWGTFVISGGRLADLYGKRRIFLLGSIVFTLTSLMAALSFSINMLIFSRILQGVGGALLSPASKGIIYDIFPAEKRGLGIGIVLTSVGLGLAFGPSIGGILLAFSSWHWIFLINLPVGIFSILVIHFYAGKDSNLPAVKSFDYLGMLLLSGGIFGIMYFFDQLQYGESFLLFVLLICSLLSLSFFIFVQKYKQYPLVNLEIFRSQAFIGAILSRSLLNGIFSLIFVLVAIFMQGPLDYSSLKASMLMLAATLVFGTVSPLGGRLTDVIDSRVPAVVGFFLLLIAALLLSRMTINVTSWELAAVLALFGLGMGITNPATTAATMESITGDISLSYSITTMCSMITASLFILGGTALMVKKGHTELLNLLSQKMQLDPSQLQNLNKVILESHLGLKNLQSFPTALQPIVHSVYHQAVADAFSVNMHLCGILAILGMIVSWFMSPIKLLPKSKLDRSVK